MIPHSDTSETNYRAIILNGNYQVVASANAESYYPENIVTDNWERRRAYTLTWEIWYNYNIMCTLYARTDSENYTRLRTIRLPRGNWRAWQRAEQLNSFRLTTISLGFLDTIVVAYQRPDPSHVRLVCSLQHKFRAHWSFRGYAGDRDFHGRALSSPN